MKFKVFKNAKNLSTYLKNIGETDKTEYWEAEFPDGSKLPITIEKTTNGTRINCTCKQCSVNGQGYLCSYKSALVYKKCSRG